MILSQSKCKYEGCDVMLPSFYYRYCDEHVSLYVRRKRENAAKACSKYRKCTKLSVKDYKAAVVYYYQNGLQYKHPFRIFLNMVDAKKL